MKFLTETDKALLACEMGMSPDALTEEDVHVAIQGHRKLVGHLKRFRRRQAGRRSWRAHRPEYMRALKRWHKSIPGKRMHRALARYLVHKAKPSAGREVSPSISFEEAFEYAKAMSSLRTHLAIESSYYYPASEQVEWELVVEGLVPALFACEREMWAIGLDDEMPYEMHEEAPAWQEAADDDHRRLAILCHLVDPNELAKEIGEVIGPSARVALEEAFRLPGDEVGEGMESHSVWNEFGGAFRFITDLVRCGPLVDAPLGTAPLDEDESSPS